MRYFLYSTLAISLGMLFAPEALGAPILEMRIRSGTYDSGIISGAIASDGLSGSVGVTDFAVSGGGGDEFTIGAVSATFGLAPSLVLDLDANSIVHNANISGSIRIYLTLAGLSDPMTPLLFVDQFAGSLAATLPGTLAISRVHLSTDAFGTKMPLFDTGTIRALDPGPVCTLSRPLDYACGLQALVPSVPGNPYAITEMVQLNFGVNTLNLSENFRERLADPAIPEPQSLFLFAIGLLGAAAFRFRRSLGELG